MEIKANQERITKLDAKIDKNQKYMWVLVKTVQELLNPEATDKAVEYRSLTPSPEATTLNSYN